MSHGSRLLSAFHGINVSGLHVSHGSVLGWCAICNHAQVLMGLPRVMLDRLGILGQATWPLR